MNKYNKNVNSILDGLKPAKSQEELVKKHSKELHMSPSKTKKILKKQLKMGEKVEKEHTNSKKIANVIARHHEDENLKYYDKLKKSKL